jgi:hypothetical protein
VLQRERFGAEHQNADGLAARYGASERHSGRIDYAHGFGDPLCDDIADADRIAFSECDGLAVAQREAE